MHGRGELGNLSYLSPSGCTHAVHSQPDSGSLNRQNLRKIVSLTHTDKHTAGSHTSISQSGFGHTTVPISMELFPHIFTTIGI